MQVTKELIDNDILAMEANVDNLKAQMAQTLGALTTLKNIREYLDKPDPKPEVVVKETPVEILEKVNQVVDANGKYNDIAVEVPVNVRT